MEIERLRAFLRKHRRVALDTSIFIYQLEDNPHYVGLTNHIFSWLERPASTAVTSTITMTELLVQPYRAADERRINQFLALLSTYPNLNWVAPDLDVADLAAQIRAAHRFRTPDALQAATAIRARATGFITNDPIFKRLASLEVLLLDPLD
ncbi:MAG: PIN domain-containing protein [Terriglobales bacterium]